MGPITSEHLVKSEGVELDMLVGPQFASPYSVLSVLYQRTAAGAEDIVLSATWQGVEFTIDKVTGMTATFYVFPNSRVPYPVSLPEQCKIHLKTTGSAGAATHSAIVQWAQGT